MNNEKLPESLWFIRGALSSDRDFIEANWKLPLQKHNYAYKMIEPKTFFRKFPRVIDEILSMPGVEVKVACLRETPDVCLGYSVIQDNSTLHWMYVKSVWQRFGIGTRLLPQEFKRITHYTSLGRDLWLKKYPHVVFDPFLFE